ncbi:MULTISPECIES: chemotaxis protein CheW [Paenibacillus]|uniref:Chemotaxis protein CheW n=1 Tax=Paenibacillus naphthalenovorans TaxID=162209 RepID=A0A0U2WCE7_9BACL|nr:MULTISPECIES: chemotaxis protein CheW [Paenibacillus]ALS25101.1 chemotaxis protein CheW [Paenibacillus naphthalenovorans]GCL73209.1 chemotaxis protein CheW [Paenibacillus naphthalenovorans]SDI35873.1 purine-binding chemotaxis protein CheW [Paenibacillus naphthalenovorans]
MEVLQQDQYIVIELGTEEYALKISEVYEIIKMQKITAIPNSRAFLEGVTNIRGKIVPIISLRKRFQLGETSVIHKARIVVVNHNEEMIGIVVDGVNQVIKFSDIQPSTEIVSGVDGSYFQGIGQSEEGLIGILNLEHVLVG